MEEKRTVVRGFTMNASEKDEVLDRNPKYYEEEAEEPQEEGINITKLLYFYAISLGVLVLMSITLIIMVALPKKNKNIAGFYESKELYSIEQSIGYWLLNEPEECNDSILNEFLIANNAWYPEVLLIQAKIESGNYKSNLFVNNNNLYGMKTVYKRPTTQIGENNGYGYYHNWCLSALDRILWDLWHFKEKPTKEEYLKYLTNYAEDSNYIDKIK